MNAARQIHSILFCLTLWPGALYAGSTTSIHDVAVRPGVTVRVLLIKPERPVATVLLFPGGNGRVSFQADGNTSYRGFPVRKPALFVEQGFAAAVINAPSDRLPDPAMYYFRNSVTHAEDVRQVIAMLRKETNVPVWLIGHSAGSTSVTNASIRLHDSGPDGLVLMSSVNGKFYKYNSNLDQMNIEEITIPTLVLSHEQDECEYTLFRNAKRLVERLKKASRSELISFKGGGPVEGDACGSLHYHGFPGIEQEVTSRIADWIKATLKR